MRAKVKRGRSMIQREKDRDEIMNTLVDMTYHAILTLPDGAEESISGIIRKYYLAQGYEFKHCGRAYAWTKDGGKTFSIEDSDQFDVLEETERKLKGQRILDFSKYYGLTVGIPYNLLFTVRVVK